MDNNKDPITRNILILSIFFMIAIMISYFIGYTQAKNINLNEADIQKNTENRVEQGVIGNAQLSQENAIQIEEETIVIPQNEIISLFGTITNIEQNSFRLEPIDPLDTKRKKTGEKILVTFIENTKITRLFVDDPEDMNKLSEAATSSLGDVDLSKVKVKQKNIGLSDIKEGELVTITAEIVKNNTEETYLAKTVLVPVS